MAHPIDTLVIAVAGTSGSGKTTLVRVVAGLLGDAATLFFDDYENSSTYPTDWSAWWRAGGDPDAVKTPQLAADLRTLRGGASVLYPTSGHSIAPAAFVVVDEPFGRARAEVRNLIDFVACLDVPLEVALARRVLRALDATQNDSHLRDELRQIARSYLPATSREVYRAANAAPTARCDLILDGLRDPQALAAELFHAVRARTALPRHQAQ